MKIKGHFVVELRDGVEDPHFPNGEWIISRGYQTVVESVNYCEHFFSDMSPLRSRLSAVREGDFLSGQSYYGGTGIEGQILQRAANYLLVSGIAWGSVRAAFYAPGKFIFETGTFDVRVVNAVYSGSLKEFHGEWVDKYLLRRMMEHLYPEELTAFYKTRTTAVVA